MKAGPSARAAAAAAAANPLVVNPLGVGPVRIKVLANNSHPHQAAPADTDMLRGRSGDGAVRVNVTQLRRRKPDGREVTGFLAVVENPVGHFGFAPSAASRQETVGDGVSRYTCEEEDPVAMAKANKCVYATNAGLFNMESGQCIGHLVHQGRILQVDDSDHRASFGITQSGYLMAGYVRSSQLFFHHQGFAELLTGRGWLIQSGTVRVNASIAAEHIDDEFVNEQAPRTGVGFDRDGRLLLLQLDGDEASKLGMNLREFADYFAELGAFSAVNLDGGGSSITIIKGEIANKPTCSDTARVCVRDITTIACVY